MPSRPSRAGISRTTIPIRTRSAPVRRRPRRSPRRVGCWCCSIRGKQRFNAAYNADLITYGINAGDPGLAVGEAAAIALHGAHYRPDPGLPPNFGIEEIGQWRSLPNAMGQLVPFGFYYLAFSTPFALNRVDQFRPQPPPPMKSVPYARDYAEVKKTARTPRIQPPTRTSRRKRGSGR